MCCPTLYWQTDAEHGVHSCDLISLIARCCPVCCFLFSLGLLLASVLYLFRLCIIRIAGPHSGTLLIITFFFTPKSTRYIY
jgi:hypothetical protein